MMKINNQQDLEVAIDRLVAKELVFKDIDIDVTQLDDDLKNFTIRFSGEQMNGTISAPMMKAFLDLQSKLNQSYCDIVHHHNNTNKLKAHEKEQLTLYFKVEKGSTNVEVNIAEIFKLFIDKMTPEQMAATVITLGASYVLGLGIKSFVNDRANKRQLALEEKIALENNQLKREELAHQRELAKMTSQNTAEAFKRYEGLTKLLIADGKTEHATALAHQREASEKMIAAAGAVGDLTIGDFEASQAALQVIAENEREVSNLVRLDGPYKVRIIDATKSDVFKVEVSHIETHEQFSAIVQDNTAANAYNQFIRDALGAKTPLYLRIQAKEKRGKIVEAVIIEAELIGDD